MKRVIITLSLIALIFGGCTKDKNPANSQDQTEETFITGDIKVSPTFFSLENLAVVKTYDIKFHIVNRSPDLALNGGFSGSAIVSGKNLGGVDFNAECNTTDGFMSDQNGNYVIGDKWYNYDLSTHTIHSKNEIYLIHGVDYKYYKLRIDSYAQGMWTFTFSLVDAAGKPGQVTTSSVAATETTPTYFLFSIAETVTIQNWDIAFLTVPMYIAEMGATILNPGARINSLAGVEVATMEGTSYESIMTLPSGLTFQKDVGDSLILGSSILNYDTQTHKLTPPDVVYFLKTSSGKYAKLKITSYYDPITGKSGYINFMAAILQ